MRKMLKMSIACAVMMGAGAVSAQADNVDVLSNVKVNGQVRARYENVNTDNTKPSANAITNRLVIGASADMFGTSWLSAYAEMTNVYALNNNYNDLNSVNGVENNNIVKDSQQTRLTQAYVDAKMGKTMLRVGRQVVNLDNQRFIGSVDWRQMPQTFEAFTLVNSDINNLTLIAAYVTKVNTVGNAANGTASSNLGNANGDTLDTKSVVLHADYKVMDELKVTAYDYMIGAGSGTAAGATRGAGCDTYGLALTGDVAVADAKLNYRAEYAKQANATMENSNYVKPAGTVDDVDAHYYDLEVGANVSGILANVQYEVLSGTNGTDGKTSLQTPLATLHAHNGWADMFLVTPAKGLVDTNIMVGYTSKDLGTAKVVYHNFASDVGSIKYGTELDVLYTRAIPGVNNLTGMLKYANYSAGDTVAEGNYAAQATDTSKFWAMLDYKFASK